MFCGSGQLPKHLYVWVESRYIQKNPATPFVRAVWFSLVSFPGRAWGITVMLESGAVYRNLPPHAIAFEEDAIPWEIEDAQKWDCYGEQFSTIEYKYLSGLDCLCKIGQDKLLTGSYLFTAIPLGDAFSAVPEQNKEFMFIRLDNNRLTIQPTDRIVFQEKSFTEGLAFPCGLKRNTTVYSCE